MGAGGERETTGAGPQRRAGRADPRPPWQLWTLALTAPLLALGALDLALRVANLAPPAHPLLQHARARSASFSPFVRGAGGDLVVAPEWASDGEAVAIARGGRSQYVVLEPGFRPASLPASKPRHELRVVALGGSTTFGLYVGAEEAFPAVLGRELAALHPERSVRVVNLGCAGWGSERTLALLETAFELEPDLIVVYTGHNELLAGESEVGILATAVRARLALLRASLLFDWLDHALTHRSQPQATGRLDETRAARAARGAIAFEPLALAAEKRRLPSARWRASAASRYESNLRAIARRARHEGVPLLLSLPVANLVFPPMASAHADGFEASARFDTALERAASALASRRYDVALDALDAALALSPEHAQAHYWRAAALVGLGRRREARGEFQRALDSDVRTHRITSPLESAFLAAVEAEDAAWVDPRPAFRAELSVAAAQRLFFDHVHPTAEGHAHLAAALVGPAHQLLERAAGEPSRTAAGDDRACADGSRSRSCDDSA